MPFDLTIGTERAQALQDAIQDELTQRGYSPDADPVMAEYITIMLINNKTADQITSELQDLIGVNEYDASFTKWLFAEATKRSAQPEPKPQPEPEPQQPPAVDASQSARDNPPHAGSDASRRASSGPRGGAPLYQQAITQALPATSPSGQKRTASARSLSPNSQQPNKARRTDLPTGPRAMYRDGGGPGQGPPAGSSRSLLDRMGGRARPGHGRDEVQARIDAVTNQPLDAMQMGAFGNGMGGMMMGPNDMGGMGGMGGVVNPLALHDMMMNQMALMAQMANTMGIMAPQAQFAPNGAFPMMNGMNGAFPDGAQNMFHQPQQQQQQHTQGGNRRGGHGGRGRGRGGASQWVAPHVAEANNGNHIAAPAPSAPASASIVAQTPQPVAVAAPAASTSTASARPTFVPPERPQSPTLCKFGLKCTNALCRYSHPSPVSTPESGVVLSNDPCEAGKNCKDKDCIKAHVSPAVLNPSQTHVSYKSEPSASARAVPCRYGAGCAKINSGCPFAHPAAAKAGANGAGSVLCRFGAGCTRAACPFQHPPDRVLPSTFHRGLSAAAPVVSVSTPEAGSIGAPSPHRSVVFNKPVKPAKEQEKKDGAEAAVVQSETKTVEATA